MRCFDEHRILFVDRLFSYGGFQILLKISGVLGSLPNLLPELMR